LNKEDGFAAQFS